MKESKKFVISKIAQDADSLTLKALLQQLSKPLFAESVKKVLWCFVKMEGWDWHLR